MRLRWIEVTCRVAGALLGGAGVLGFVWFFNTTPISAVAPPAFLLVLSVLPPDRIARHPWIVLLGLGLCVVDIVFRGFPFLREYKELDVEIYLFVQWVLIAYFAISTIVRWARDPVSWIRSLFQH